MTMIALALLGCAWAGYCVYCLKDAGGGSSQRRNRTRDFSRSLVALGQPMAGPRWSSLAGGGRGHSRRKQPPPPHVSLVRPPAGAGSGRVPPPQSAPSAPFSLSGDGFLERSLEKPGTLLERPRTPHAASCRRRNVVLTLGTIALVALAAVPRVGAAGWVVHVASGAALLCFMLAVHRRRNRSAEAEITALMSNLDSAGNPGTAWDRGLTAENGLAGPVNGLAGPVNGLAGPVNGLAGPVNGLAGPVNGLAGPVNGRSGSVNGGAAGSGHRRAGPANGRAVSREHALPADR